MDLSNLVSVAQQMHLLPMLALPVTMSAAPTTDFTETHFVETNEASAWTRPPPFLVPIEMQPEILGYNQYTLTLTGNQTLFKIIILAKDAIDCSGGTNDSFTFTSGATLVSGRTYTTTSAGWYYIVQNASGTIPWSSQNAPATQCIRIEYYSDAVTVLHATTCGTNYLTRLGSDNYCSPPSSCALMNTCTDTW